MRLTRISRDPHPDHDGSDILLYSDTGYFLGQLIFQGKAGQQTSRLEQPPEQTPYRPMTLKRKHRRT